MARTCLTPVLKETYRTESSKTGVKWVLGIKLLVDLRLSVFSVGNLFVIDVKHMPTGNGRAIGFSLATKWI